MTITETFCRDFEIPQSKDGLSVARFCPVCHAQVFGFMLKATVDDLHTHVTVMHPVTRAGQA